MSSSSREYTENNNSPGVFSHIYRRVAIGEILRLFGKEEKKEGRSRVYDTLSGILERLSNFLPTTNNLSVISHTFRYLSTRRYRTWRLLK